MSYRSLFVGAVGLLAAVAVAGPSAAARVHFSGSGVFGPTISTLLPVEVPGETFSFSFDLPNPVAGNPATGVTQSLYYLDGAKVDDAITSITLYPVSGPGALDGGFDINFASGGPVSLYAADVGSTLTLVPGVYPFTLDSPSSFAGSGSVTLTTVPEPASWALMIAGFGLVGGAMRRRVIAYAGA